MILKSLLQSKVFWLALVCFIMAVIFLRVSSPSIAQSGERLIDNQIPKNIPIKVQIKKEKEQKVKELSNQNWIQDLEIEITNESDKPIYFLRIWVEPADVKPEGKRYVFPIGYGRIDFVSFDERPNADDVPIKPKETITFPISDIDQRGWSALKSKGMLSGDPSKLVFSFVHLSFGDGTGFTGLDGQPFPFKRKPEEVAKCQTTQPQAREEAPSWRSAIKTLAFFSPAILLPVNFLGSAVVEAEPNPDICCPGTSCQFQKLDHYRCATLSSWDRRNTSNQLRAGCTTA